MKFLEVRDGVSVKVDKIVAVERGDTELTSKVVTPSGTFDSGFPYITLLSILEGEHEKESERKEGVLREISQKVGDLPVWSG